MPNFLLLLKICLGIDRPYISEDAAYKLKQYKYQGGDTGFLYRYLYNPLALKMIEYTPDTLA